MFSSILLSGFTYFDTGIDYWKQKPTPTPNRSVTLTPKTSPAFLPLTPTPASFDWGTQLNPKNDEFFKEGDYTPPRAFMEIARNPSDENIKNWFKYIELKNQLSDRLQRRIAEYVQKNTAMPVESRIALQNVKQEIPPLPTADITQYRFRLYVDSHCPHCQRMLGTMKTFHNQGYFVEIRQVDDGPLKQFASVFPIERATPKELNAKDINAVPVLFVADLKQHVVFRISGFQTPEAVLLALQTQKPFR